VQFGPRVDTVHSLRVLRLCHYARILGEWHTLHFRKHILEMPVVSAEKGVATAKRVAAVMLSVPVKTL